MTKKQRNRKLVAQNKRNRIVNRRYSSTVRTLSKLFKRLINLYKANSNLEFKEKIKLDLSSTSNKLYSMLDKAVKKRVLHKNNANRKKAHVGKLFRLTFL